MAPTDPKPTIVGALFTFSGSGQGVDDMLLDIAKGQTEQILSDLNDDGFVIVRREWLTQVQQDSLAN